MPVILAGRSPQDLPGLDRNDLARPENDQTAARLDDQELAAGVPVPERAGAGGEGYVVDSDARGLAVPGP